MRRHPHRAGAARGPRLHRRLGHSCRRPAGSAGGQRGLPRLLGARLHERRAPPGLERRLRRVRELRAPARAEGLPGRGRQPHGGRRPPRGRHDVPRPGGDAVPRLPRQAVRSGELRGREDVPVPVSPLPAAAAAADRGEPLGEAPVLDEPGRPLPQPGGLRLRELLVALLRAGRLLRPRRPLHRAAVRRERPRDGLRRLDPAVPAGRLPGRHGEARRPRVLPGLGAEDPCRGSCCGRPRLRGLRRGDDHRRGRPRNLRARQVDPERARLPAAGRAHALRGRIRRRPRHLDAPRGRRLLPPARRGRPHAADLPREPRPGPRRARDQGAGGRRRARSSSRATCSATACCTCFAAHPSCTTATRSG